MIKDLIDQLERALTDKTRSCEDDIQKLKSERSEACSERINAANRLTHADRVTTSLNLKLDETNKKLRQQNGQPAAERCEEAPGPSTKDS